MAIARLPRILLVDDDEATLVALADALHLRIGKVIVDIASSAEQALTQVGSETYDLIISDILMPGTDGLVLLDETQRMCPWVPVILVTGDLEREEAALYSGAYAYLEKPLKIDPFIAVVRGALDRSRLQQRLPEGGHTGVAQRMALFPAPQHRQPR